MARIFPVLDRGMRCSANWTKINIGGCLLGGGEGEEERESQCVLQKPLNNQSHKCLFL